jgi:hypothetical protein
MMRLPDQFIELVSNFIETSVADPDPHGFTSF